MTPQAQLDLAIALTLLGLAGAGLLVWMTFFHVGGLP